MNSSLTLYEAFLSITVFRNVGIVKLPGNIIEESKPVYPIISLLIIAAVEKPGDSSIRRLVKGSAGVVRDVPK